MPKKPCRCPCAITQPASQVFIKALAFQQRPARQPCQPVPALCSLDCWRSWQRLLWEGESLQDKQPAALAAWADLLGQGCSLCTHGSARHRAHLSQTQSPSLQLLWNKSWSAQCWVSGICPSAVKAQVLLQAPLLKGRCSFPCQAFLEGSGCVCSP